MSYLSSKLACRRDVSCVFSRVVLRQAGQGLQRNSAIFLRLPEKYSNACGYVVRAACRSSYCCLTIKSCYLAAACAQKNAKLYDCYIIDQEEKT